MESDQIYVMASNVKHYEHTPISLIILHLKPKVGKVGFHAHYNNSDLKNQATHK